MFTLRPYQEEAVQAGLSIIAATKVKNGILVLPTGTGKSLVIAELAIRSGLKTVILQPTKEILEQNVSKMRSYGVDDIGIYSASMGEKTIGHITFATIGTIIKKKEAFESFGLIIVDECHLVNSKGGQYEDFISHLEIPTVGLTATPFRMRAYKSFDRGEPVVECRFLTRTRPRIFSTINHVTQIPDMCKDGYLCPIEYDYDNEYDSRKVKNRGQGFDDNALMAYNDRMGIVDNIVNQVRDSKSKHILIFVKFVAESTIVINRLAEHGISCCEVSGTTKKKDREQVLGDFMSGDIRCVVNVGVLTVGFDFPALDQIIIGRPTKSLGLFYQICGRGLRPCEGKTGCKIVDLCDNIKRFGRINTFELEDLTGNGIWRLWSDNGFLTGVNVLTGQDLEKHKKASNKERIAAATGEFKVTFGKHIGKPVTDLDDGYLGWCVKKFNNGKWKTIFEDELARRKENAVAV